MTFTDAQKLKIEEYRERYFNRAVSCEIGDHAAAEKAALRLAEIAGIYNPDAVWVDSPEDVSTPLAPLQDSLWVSLWASLWASLGASLWDPLCDLPQFACYVFAVEELGAECSPEHRELIGLFDVISANAFAIWIQPREVTLLERPASVEIVDGKLTGITWRGDVCLER